MITPKLTSRRVLAASGVLTLSLLTACGGDGGRELGSNSVDVTGRDLPPVEAGAFSKAAIPGVDCNTQDCETLGAFTAPFEEPVVYDRGEDNRLDNNLPINNPLRPIVRSDNCEFGEDGRPVNCKPGAGTINLLPNGEFLFFSALEGTESAEFSIVSEGGQVLNNDQVRVMGMTDTEATWTLPSPIDGGADDEDPFCLLPGCLLNTDAADPRRNSGSLFCADVNALPDGSILAVGGSNYYSEPGIDTPFNIGVVELEGLNSARVFNPSENAWVQLADMNYGRWYPTLVSMADGNQFVASGVTKLLKPVYLTPNPTRLDEPYLSTVLGSGANVRQTETFDLGCMEWTDNGGAAQRSLPLFPRLHLLPNGHVYYNGGGQAFNPFGQAVDQALWNIVGAYNPDTQSWTDLGYAGLPLELNELGLSRLTQVINPQNDQIGEALQGLVGDLAGGLTNLQGAVFDPLVEGLSGAPLETVINAVFGGFRGSATSLMMPLKPNADGEYDKAEFLTAGGVLGGVTATSPGLFVGVPASRIDTVSLDGDAMEYRSRLTGFLGRGRWYGQAVLMPTGEVMMFSGATHDEVVLPGTAFPITQTEMFDPETETWSDMAEANNPRTYHNSALLMEDGRILVGGHAPINTGYAFSLNLEGLGISPNFGRDPSFEIYNPPYVFRDRPRLTGAPVMASAGQTFTVNTPDASTIDSVVLVRRTTLTHLVDGDQRNVELAIVGRSGGSLQVRMPAEQAVVPPGQYMLFIVRSDDEGKTPSTSLPVRVTGENTTCEV